MMSTAKNMSISLEGLKKLTIKTPKGNEKSFDLVEVTTEELAAYRKRKIPSFVLKIKDKFYYASIPGNIKLVSANILMNGAHQCAIAHSVCAHLSAASDKDGGCEKVRSHSQCIENYPWITTGYETFNTRHDIFIVNTCLHYEKCLKTRTTRRRRL